MVQPIILEKLEQLSESLQTEVLHYIEFLSERYPKTNSDPRSLQRLRPKDSNPPSRSPLARNTTV